MKTLLVLIAAISRLCAATAVIPTTSSAQPNLLSSYLSFSIELDHFPNYAGNSTSGINQYSINLLQNLGNVMSAMPVIRVGGDSADRYVYQPNQEIGLVFGCPAGELCMGPTFFDSYNSFPNTYYSHGLNMAWDNSTGYQSLKQTVAAGCKTLEGKLSTWEFGNEPDLYIGSKRPSNWSPADYVAEWKNGSAMILEQLQATCPSLASSANFVFMAPSIAGVYAKLSPTGVFSAGLDDSKTVSKVSIHNYMGSSESSGLSLQDTLMSHNKNVYKLNEHAQLAQSIAAISGLSGVPYILGETNSITGGGAKGISNSFGAALWGLDFVLQGAATNQIKRIHFHQGVGSPYAAWNPVAGFTCAPYYGHLAAATFMGKSELRSVLNISLSDDNDLNSAYAGYNTQTGALDRIAVINLRLYNSTVGGTRGNNNYAFKVTPSSNWTVQRLEAPGGESVTGLTFGGYAYEYSTVGKPKAVGVTNEVANVGSDGILSLTLPDSGAVILSLESS